MSAVGANMALAGEDAGVGESKGWAVSTSRVSEGVGDGIRCMRDP